MKRTRGWIGLPALVALAAGTGLGAPQTAEPTKLTLTEGKSAVIDSPVEIRRVSVADFAVIEAVAVSPKELLVNAKKAGDTSLILWEQTGRRVSYEISVRPNAGRLDSVRDQLEREMDGQQITLAVQGATVFLRGTAKDLVSAERAAAIAGTLGKVVNLIRVNVPPVEPQVLLKVRFANIDRAAARDLGLNIFSTGALNTVGCAQHRTVLTAQGGFRPGRAGLQHVRRFERFSVPARPQPGGHASARCRRSACWRSWPSRTCWRSTASPPASCPAANFRFRPYRAVGRGWER